MNVRNRDFAGSKTSGFQREILSKIPLGGEPAKGYE